MKKIVLFFYLLIFTFIGYAQQGYLDTTFNSSSSTPGQVILPALTGESNAMAVDGKGNIYLVSSDTAANKIRINVINPDGTFNINFNKTGLITINSPGKDFVNCISLDSDGSIFLGGLRHIIANYNNMIVLKLKPNGSIDTTFGKSGYWEYNFVGYNNQVDKILVGPNNILVAGALDYDVAYIRLNKFNASFDPLFASGKGYMRTGIIRRLAKITAMNNAIYVGGDSSGIYRILKISSDGSFDKTFGIGGIASLSSYYSDILFGFEFQPDGKIILGGSASYYSFRVARLNSNGILDTTFISKGDTLYGASVGYFSGQGNLHRLTNGSIIITGFYSYDGTDILKLNPSGLPNNSFGTGGQLVISNSPTLMKTYLTEDQRLLVFTKDNGKQFTLRKIFNQSVFHISGSNFVSPKSVQSYTVAVPSSWAGATFTWSYKGNNTSFISATSGSNVSLYVSDTATVSGLLTCTAKAVTGAPLGYQELQISINTQASASNQLSTLQCKPGVTDASANFIYFIGINELKNYSSYNDYGYWDYTQSAVTDTMIVGSAYSATVQLSNPQSKVAYVGLWIDYNNDGYFTGSEFIGQAAGTTSLIEIKNLVLQNQHGNEGAKRLRIRCRLDTAFTSNDACAKRGEVGETEDYLVVLKAQEGLSAPEVITPNEDGKNDFFVIRGVDPQKSNKFTVFDRLGEVRYSANNYVNNWNGIDKEGKKLDQGTYYFVFTNDDKLLRGFLEVRY